MTESMGLRAAARGVRSLRSRGTARGMIVLLGGVTAACGDGADPAAAWTVTQDTTAAGVPVVANIPPEGGIEPSWVIEPMVRIGTMDDEGPTQFGQIKAVDALPDGRIVVLESQAQEVRIFDEAGEHVATHGGKGEGPGELSNANGLLVGDDGLVRVHDPHNARLSFFHPERGFLTSERLQIQSWGFLWRAVIDSVGRIIDDGIVGGRDDRWRALKIYDADGRWVDTVRLEKYAAGPSVADPPGVYRYRGGLSQVPYWPAGARAKDPAGFYWSKPANVNEYRLAKTTFAGDTLLVFSSLRPALPVSPAERDSVIAMMKERAGETEMDWSLIPGEKPIVQGMFLDDRGRPWVRVNASDTVVTFDVFERNGEYAGTAVTSLEIPSYWHPVVRGDRIYTLITGEFDVPYAVVGRITPVDEIRGGG